MAWETAYKKKLMTADAAVRAVESDMRVYVHGNAAFPLVLSLRLQWNCARE
jgi:hypothetical protein